MLRHVSSQPAAVEGQPPPAVAEADVEGLHPLRRIRRVATAPLKRYLDGRFDDLERRLGQLGVQTTLETPSVDESAAALAKVDVSAHNAGGSPPTFDTVVSQVVSAAQFSHPDFQRISGILFPSVGLIPCGALQVPSTGMHRKLWEWCYILRAAELHGKLSSGATAIGFGVGSEPVPAALVNMGSPSSPPIVHPRSRRPGRPAVSTWPTSIAVEAGCRSRRPTRAPGDGPAVDMNDVPDDLGRFDLVWSSCALSTSAHPGPD